MYEGWVMCIYGRGYIGDRGVVMCVTITGTVVAFIFDGRLFRLCGCEVELG